MNFRQLFIFILTLGLFASSAYSQKYERVISLAPSLTKSMYFLEAGDQLAGCTSYCKMEKGESKEIVASAIQVNLEKILSLQPDLVIATTITNPETIASLRKFGIPVEVFPSPKNFNEICLQFISLGELIGKENTANRIVKEAKAKVDSLSTLRQKKDKVIIFFQIGANPLFTVTPNTFMDEYIYLAGGTNMAADLTHGTMSRESVLARNPDVIFIVTMGITGEEEKKIWESYTDLKATRSKSIFIIDSYISCMPTPLTFAETLEIMINLLDNPSK